MSNHSGPEALGLATDGIDQLILQFFFFVIDKFYLDQFVFFQGGIDGGNDFGRQTVFPDKNQWFESMGKASEVFVLLAGEVLRHGSMRSCQCFDADSAQLVGLVSVFKICPVNNVLKCVSRKGAYLC